MRNVAVALIIIAGVLIAAYYLSPHFSERSQLNPLGEYYLKNSYLPEDSARAPEVVTAILWDYRGLDTYFETAVLFLAIISAVSVFRSAKLPFPASNLGFTGIVKTGAKLIAFITFVAAGSIAFHGHLTPGGGFQGGSILAGASILVIVAFSKKALERNGLDKSRALALRTLGLGIIIAFAFYPLLRGFHFMQNQPVYPAELFNMLVSGSISAYNLAEFLAVGAGFTIIFLLLSSPERGWKG
ncbi:MnhB domain-containing protein [Thermococcus barophilus]|uniref:Membrane bound subgroup 4b [NiFe]-hydrogenase MBH(B)1, subunit Mbh(B)1(E+F) (Fused) n=1 Tax=Thermococcus barophilus TaxID=55802 RepID=A0A0S1XA45_THEBA|nr:MnhB domain-containing protein [Thermococcus barophilus]ALM74608.1 Membrane bound subgroup 4b [NiFe]-hydrogenase MBH(b)1, subunit Mbh(b)1(E+F) (fused) [Thermococcus barophilus]